MGTSIDLRTITSISFKSKDIKVFPCTARNPEYDKEARLNTERNFTKLGSGGFGSRTSYIKNWNTSGDNSTDGILRCNICGYDFEINTTEYSNLLEAGWDSYLVLTLNKVKITSDVTTYTIGVKPDIYIDNKSFNSFDGLRYFKIESSKDASVPDITIETIEKNPSLGDDRLYYALQIGKNGKKAAESFLPEIDTLQNGGIKVRDLEIAGAGTSRDWVAKHLMAKPGVYVNKTSLSGCIDIGLNLNNETAEQLDSGFNSLSSTNESLNLPLQLFKVKGATKLGVKIPKNRAIYVKDYKDELKQLPESSVLLFDHQGGIQLDIKKDTEGKDTLSIGSRYTNPLYKDGLAIANNIEPNGLKADYIYVPHASHISEGVVKVASEGDKIKTKDLTTSANVDYRNYSIKTNTDNVLYVTVPWKNYDSDIANLQAEITDIKKSLEGPEISNPYEGEPYAELLINNETVASSQGGSYTINQPLSEYTLRINHNKLSSVSEINIDISAATGNIDFNEVDDGRKYKDYSLIDLGLATGTDIQENFIIIIDYLDGYKENMGSRVIRWNLKYNLPAQEVEPNHDGDPIIEIVDPEDIELATLKITTNARADVKTAINYCTCELGWNTISYGDLIITDLKEDPKGVWSAKLNQYKSYLPKGEFILVPHVEIFYDGQEPETVRVDKTDGFTLNLIEPTPDVLWSTDSANVSWNIYINNENGEVEDFLHYPDLNQDILIEFNYDPTSGLTFHGQVGTNVCQPLQLHKLTFNAPPAIAGASLESAEFKCLSGDLSVSGNIIKYEGLSWLLENDGIENPQSGKNVTVDLSFNINYRHNASGDIRVFPVELIIKYYNLQSSPSVD